MPPLGDFLPNTPLPWKWFYFQARFDGFLANLDPTVVQIQGGVTSLKGVVACLNAHYWNQASDTAHAQLGGGWSKRLWVRPPRDIDLLFSLPGEVYLRFQARQGNRQSGLLQEVKGVLSNAFPLTDLRGDGQVVVVPFAHVAIEVVPAFLLPTGRFLICDANDGGSYKESDTAAEIAVLDWADGRYHGCARPLIRMAKQWQRHCNVPIPTFQIERLVIEFLAGVSDTCLQHQWWDWLLRDFFGYMKTRAHGIITMPGTGTYILLGDAWLSRAESAHARAIKACSYEAENEDYLAGTTWQLVFGTMIPASAA